VRGPSWRRPAALDQGAVVVGGALIVLSVVFAVWSASHVISPSFMKYVYNWVPSTHIAVAAVYTFAAIVTIIHIITVIYFGISFNNQTNQPSWWLYSVLIGILFEMVLSKLFIFMMNLFGISALAKLIEIIFFGEDFLPATPTEVFGAEAPKMPNLGGQSKGNMKATTQATFETAFEEEEFGTLGPIEEPVATEHKQNDEEEGPTGPPEEVLPNEGKNDAMSPQIKETPLKEVKEENPSMVNVEDIL